MLNVSRYGSALSNVAALWKVQCTVFIAEAQCSCVTRHIFHQAPCFTLFVCLCEQSNSNYSTHYHQIFNTVTSVVEILSWLHFETSCIEIDGMRDGQKPCCWCAALQPAEFKLSEQLYIYYPTDVALEKLFVWGSNPWHVISQAYVMLGWSLRDIFTTVMHKHVVAVTMVRTLQSDGGNKILWF